MGTGVCIFHLSVLSNEGQDTWHLDYVSVLEIGREAADAKSRGILCVQQDVVMLSVTCCTAGLSPEREPGRVSLVLSVPTPRAAEEVTRCLSLTIKNPGVADGLGYTV